MRFTKSGIYLWLQKKIDKALRERLFILTVAAEEGWRVASEVAFSKRGNLADKDLAKALKNEKKRKAEETKKPKKKKFIPRWNNQPQQMAPLSSEFVAAVTAPPPPPPPRRVETRSCHYCGQVGHLYRNCPRGAAGPSK